MIRSQINSLLGALNSSPSGYRSGWVLARCPLGPWKHGGLDVHPSFGIKVNDAGESICKCQSCGFGGPLTLLSMRIQGLLKLEPAPGYNLQLANSIITHELDDTDMNVGSIPEYGEPVGVSDFEFPEWWLDTFKFAHDFPEAMTYLHSRGISTAMADRFGLRFDALQRRIGFPFRNFAGKLMGVQGRAIDKSTTLRYYQYGYHDHRNAHCWMGEDTVDFDKPVVLLEGPFDLTSVSRVYPNVLASFTSGLSKAKLSRIQDASEIITFYDFGKGGDAARGSIHDSCTGVPVFDIIPSFQQDDAGAMSREEVYAALSEYLPASLLH